MVGEVAIIFNSRLVNMNFISFWYVNIKNKFKKIKNTNKNHTKKQTLQFKISLQDYDR
jgi:archaellum component FlaF (FlaF/FlaG flagellin family)